MDVAALGEDLYAYLSNFARQAGLLEHIVELVGALYLSEPG